MKKAKGYDTIWEILGNYLEMADSTKEIVNDIVQGFRDSVLGKYDHFRLPYI